MDKWGIHAESCTGGGDKIYGHHIVRNDLFTQSKRGNMGPVLEASGVLNTLGVEDRGGANHVCGGGRERPADVLLCRAQDGRTGSGQRSNGRVALDVEIVCPQAACHISNAAGESLGAAESYVRATCGRRGLNGGVGRRAWFSSL